MREFNQIVAHFGDHAVPGELAALEGGRGMLRVTLTEAAPGLSAGSECLLEMHDGAHFRVTVTEALGDEGTEFRMKLVGRA
ncbi:hypothetical protein [Deinococcus humi]|uniref:Uncharacterized protein n=1 Tax=Deinococcus humi TaxID=662880 RepID=A0A7W8JX84_9DEIO|nr:hypothetical protein [Deinococcus humi]MBB5363416.1 hypothetical protein [Deinococcus humi]GGO26644.1 hypothetical protein GCM10008949_17550 [Deinococcus humi]